MGRLIIGIILAFFGVMVLIGVFIPDDASPDDTSDDKAAVIVFSCLMIISGGLLIYLGVRFISRRRTVVESALQMLRESDNIDAGVLVNRFGVSEIKVRKFLSYGRTKGIIPYREEKGELLAEKTPLAEGTASEQGFENYLLVLDSKMEDYGFVRFHQELHDLQVDRFFRRRKFSIIRFSIVDTFCVVKYIPKDLTTEFLKSFGRQIFKFSLKNKIWIPRGFGGWTVAYPLLVTDTISDDVRLFIRKYNPKRLASVEFPVVVELSSKSVFYYTRTPLWGLFYFYGLRKEVKRLFRFDRYQAD